MRAVCGLLGMVVVEEKKHSKHRECSHTPGKIPDPAHLPGRGFSLWGSPKPLVSDHHHRKDVNPKCLTAPTTMTI